MRGYSNRADLSGTDPCLTHRCVDHGQDALEMRACGDLWYDSCESFMQRFLRRNAFSQDPAIASQDCCGSLIARRLDG
jgi:hypothetical protein